MEKELYQVTALAVTVMEGRSLYPFPAGGTCVVEAGAMIFTTAEDEEMTEKQYKFHFFGEGNSCPPGFAVLRTDFPQGLHFNCGLAPGVSMNLYVEKVSVK